jgi:hypothetical protein
LTYVDPYRSATAAKLDVAAAPSKPASAGFSVESGQIKHRDGDEHRHGFGHRDHEHVLIGLPVVTASSVMTAPL